MGMKIKIELLSDVCTASGETHNSFIDCDVAYDEYGIPYIPAKRLKGCIREAALEMQEFDPENKAEYDALFGKQGDCRAAFSISNAYIEGYDEVVSDLNAYGKRDFASQQNVLDLYTYTRTQTAIDLETGAATENSLRTIRVIKKGICFEADCNVTDGADVRMLENAVSLVKHIGVSRTRGLGLVNMQLICEEKAPVNHVLISSEQLTDRNKLRYKIELKSSMICKSEKGNQADTQDYIAGNKILGLIAGALGREKYAKLLNQGNLIVSNAYITSEGKRCTPCRISLQKEKDQPYDENGEMVVKDMVYNPDVKNRQMTPAGISYISDNRGVSSVTTEISYHHQRPVDKSIGHATGNNDGSSFFQLSAISAGQSFIGYIYADKECAKEILDAVSGLGKIRMGYGRTSEFGDVDFTIDAVETITAAGKIVQDQIIMLASDTILYNENGMPTTELDVLKQYLEELLHVTDLEIKMPFLQFATIGGYNVTWKKRKPIFQALGKGSVMLIHSDTGFDSGLLKDAFIGERVTEGFGELVATVPADTADVCVRKIRNVVQDGKEKEKKTDIIDRLLGAELDRCLEKHVREQIGMISKKAFANPENLNASVAKMRVLLKTEKRYKDFMEQIDGIEDKSKKELCRSIVGKINPDEILESAKKEIKEKYGTSIQTTWNEQIIFQKVYHACITELKYLVKTAKGVKTK